MNSNLDKQDSTSELATVASHEVYTPCQQTPFHRSTYAPTPANQLPKEKRNAKSVWRKRYQAQRIEAKRGLARYIAKANKKEGKRVNRNSWAMQRAIWEELHPASTAPALAPSPKRKTKAHKPFYCDKAWHELSDKEPEAKQAA